MTKQLQSIALEGDAERVRRNHAEAITELQRSPMGGAVIVEGVELQDGIETNVAHRLGRRPRLVSCSIPRNAVSTGRIEEIRTGSSDRSQSIVIKASGWGATVTVDVLVV